MKPNSYTDGQSLQALDRNAATLARNGYGVVSGCSVTILNGTLGSGNAAIEVQSGTAFSGGSDVTIAQTALDVASSDAEPRKDLVIYNTSSSALEVLQGTPEAVEPAGTERQNAEQPNPPSLSPSVDAISGGGEPSIPLAEVWVPGGASAVESGDIGDRRHEVDRTLDTVSADAFAGDVTGDQTLSTLAGNNLSITSGQLDAESGAKKTLFLSDYTTPDDGTADDSAFDTAVGDASSGDTIVFDDGNYLFNSSHTVSKSLTIESGGGTLEYTNTSNNNPAILFQGGGIQGTTTTDAVARAGERTISVTSTSPFAAGDRVLFISSSYSSNLNAEIHFAEIESVDGTNSNITIFGGLGVDFASGAEVNQVDLLDSPSIVGLDTHGGGNRHLQFRWCEEPTFDHVSVSEYLEVSLYCLDCWKPRYRDVLATDPAGLASGEGEPIAIYRCTDAYVESPRVYDCRRGIDMAWGTRQVTITDPVIRGVDLNGISVHQNDFCGHVVIKGGEIVCPPGASSGRGVSMSDTADFEIDGLKVIFRDAGVLASGKAKITDCTLNPARGNTSGQSVGVNVKVSDTHIDNVTMRDPNGDMNFGVWVNPPSGGSFIEHVTIDANIHSTNGNQVYLDARNARINDVRVSGFLDNLSGTADQGIFIRADGGFKIANCDFAVHMETFANQGVRILTGSGGGRVEAINFHDCYFDVSLAAIYSDGSGTFQSIHVVNCECNTGGTSLSFNESGVEDLVIRHNRLSGSLDTSGATTIDGTVANGTVTLSSGAGSVDSGVSHPVDISLDPSNGGSNASNIDVVASTLFDSSTGTNTFEITEEDTAVGNPTVAYTIIGNPL